MVYRPVSYNNVMIPVDEDDPPETTSFDSDFIYQANKAAINKTIAFHEKLMQAKRMLNPYYLSPGPFVSGKTLSSPWYELRYEWEKIPPVWQPIYRHRYKKIHTSIAELEKEHGIAELNYVPWKFEMPDEVMAHLYFLGTTVFIVLIYFALFLMGGFTF